MLQKATQIWLTKVYSRLEPLIAIVGILGIGICLFLLVFLSWLFHEVLERESFRLDTVLLLHIHQFANPVLDAVMLTLSSLGNPEFIGPAAVVSFGLLWWKQHYQEGKVFLLACLGAAILNTGLKLLFTKSRPDLWPRLITETSFSFPSGHALGSLVVYGFLAYVTAKTFPRFGRLIYLLVSSLIAGIGVSRLYLGVHWPTDILAGYSIGFLWLIVCIIILELRLEGARTANQHQ